MKAKIAVLGGGHGAHAMAADLSLKGYEVNLCELPEFEEGFRVTLARQAVNLIDPWGELHCAKLGLATTNFEAAVRDVEYIMMNVPAVAAKAFFEKVIPYLMDGQVLIKWSGNFSALSFAKMLKEMGVEKRVTLGEGHTLPWGCRLIEPGTVQIMVWVTKLLLATFPGKNVERILDGVKAMYPVFPSENVLTTSLNNLNPIVHPIGTVMNAGWIDTVGEKFYFYKDGNTLSISRGIKGIFKEVSSVAEAVGTEMNTYPEEDFWKKSAIMSSYTRAVFDKEGCVAKISGPASVKSRYITEDIPFGLVPIRKLAVQYNTSTPLIDAVINLGSVINQTDYMREGISLEEMGISGLSRDELKHFLYEGDE
ncbi:MAG: NAD/NADP octopine/nopaline dehydrogenase family protein [Deltaproteobacteria bacterium]|nr:NAD/NADP octopine/nopaline dehydrogenase family protein [Deltaproteobacteria bacterium]